MLLELLKNARLSTRFSAAAAWSRTGTKPSEPALGCGDLREERLDHRHMQGPSGGLPVEAGPALTWAPTPRRRRLVIETPHDPRGERP